MYGKMLGRMRPGYLEARNDNALQSFLGAHFSNQILKYLQFEFPTSYILLYGLYLLISRALAYRNGRIQMSGISNLFPLYFEYLVQYYVTIQPKGLNRVLEEASWISTGLRHCSDCCIDGLSY